MTSFLAHVFFEIDDQPVVSRNSAVPYLQLQPIELEATLRMVSKMAVFFGMAI